MFNDKEYDFEYKGHHMMKNIHVVSLLSIIIIIDLDVKGTVTGLSGLTRGVGPALFKGVTKQLK